MIDPREDEERQTLARLHGRLTDDYAGRCPPEAIVRLIESAHAGFADARIRDFVPVLVERMVRAELRHTVGPAVPESGRRR